jgi:uncharacterized low-complexity protein
VLNTPQGELPQMKKIMIAAALSLSILAGSTVLFAQNDTATKATKKAKKKAKKTTATDTMSAPK